MLRKYVVEMQAPGGYRYWSKPMWEWEAAKYIEQMESYGDTFSDIDKAANRNN